MDKTKNNLKIFNFNKEIALPVYKADARKGWVKYGVNDNYPNELVDYYNFNGSSAHKAIINKKIKLILGDGDYTFFNNKFGLNFKTFSYNVIASF